MCSVSGLVGAWQVGCTAPVYRTRPRSAQEVHAALHIWMEFTPQSNSITGDLIGAAPVSAGALAKVALPEARVPGPEVHASHH